MNQGLGTDDRHMPSDNDREVELRKKLFFPLVMVMLWVAVQAPALAQETAQKTAFPRLEWSFAAEIENDFTTSADDPEAEINDLFPTIEPALSLRLNEAFSVNVSAVIEPVLDPVDDRTFKDIGGYVDTLFMQYESSIASIALGKLGVPFGVAWDIAPGIYGTGFPEDYETAEQIGSVISAPIPVLPGVPTLSVSAFFADTTALSESVGENRGRTRKSDGGVGNTESLENFAVSLDGGLAGTTYSLGFRRLAAGEGDPEDEYGVAFGLARTIDLGEDMSLEALGEIVHFINTGGAAEENSLYLTLGAALTKGDWTGSAVYALRSFEDANTDRMATVGLEYAIAEGVSFGVAYRYGREDEEISHIQGALLAVEFEGIL